MRSVVTSGYYVMLLGAVCGGIFTVWAFLIHQEEDGIAQNINIIALITTYPIVTFILSLLARFLC
jgi:hypothetical protein